MDFNVSHEALVFLYSAFGGALIGILRDIFCFFRKNGEKNSIFSDIADIVFWICASVIMFSVIYFANNGTLRWYEFLGVILGTIIYTLTLSRLFLKFFELILAIFLKIFGFFLKILLTPLIFLYNIVFEGIMFIFRPMYKAVFSIFGKIAVRVRFWTKIFKITAKKS